MDRDRRTAQHRDRDEEQGRGTGTTNRDEEQGQGTGTRNRDEEQGRGTGTKNRDEEQGRRTGTRNRDEEPHRCPAFPKPCLPCPWTTQRTEDGGEADLADDVLARRRVFPLLVDAGLGRHRKVDVARVQNRAAEVDPVQVLVAFQRVLGDPVVPGKEPPPPSTRASFSLELVLC